MTCLTVQRFVSTELHARIYMYTAQRHGMFAQMENVLTLLHADMQLFDSTVNCQAACAVEHGVAPFGGVSPIARYKPGERKVMSHGAAKVRV